eukprot:COSAG01_NODE_20089_length_971_cov_0.910550_2_plen_55_part_01
MRDHMMLVLSMLMSVSAAGGAGGQQRQTPPPPGILSLWPMPTIAALSSSGHACLE